MRPIWSNLGLFREIRLLPTRARPGKKPCDVGSSLKHQSITMPLANSAVRATGFLLFLAGSLLLGTVARADQSASAFVHVMSLLWL